MRLSAHRFLNFITDASEEKFKMNKLLEALTANNSLPFENIVVALAVSCAIAIYIFFIYKLATKSAFYSKSFNVSMALTMVVTTGIILAMQSSLVISLGMVGALSIVRFRTAIKEPMDLLFLFWAIGEGIICGAGLFPLAVILCLLVTAGIFLLNMFPVNRAPYLLILNSSDSLAEEKLLPVLKKNCKSHKIKSRNLTSRSLDMIVEIRTSEEKALLKELEALGVFASISLLSHDGETRY